MDVIEEVRGARDVSQLYVWDVTHWRGVFCARYHSIICINCMYVTWLISKWTTWRRIPPWRCYLSLVRCVLYVISLDFMYETWLIHMWDMTYSYMRHDSFIHETWLMHIRLHHTVEIGWQSWMSLMRYQVCLVRNVTDLFHEAWLIHMWDMTYSYMRHDSFIQKTWLMHTIRGMSHVACIWMSHIRETWLMFIRDWCILFESVVDKLATLDVIEEVRDVTHPFIYETGCLHFACHSHSVSDVTHSYICDVTRSRVRHDVFIYETWLVHVTHVYTTARHGRR